jgi:hypothetical protein
VNGYFALPTEAHDNFGYVSIFAQDLQNTAADIRLHEYLY